MISVNGAHLKSAYKGTIFTYSGLTGNEEAYILAFGISGGNEDYRTGIYSIHFLQNPVHQCHLWKIVNHIPSGIKDWISHCLKFSQGIMQQIVFIILSRM